MFGCGAEGGRRLLGRLLLSAVAVVALKEWIGNVRADNKGLNLPILAEGGSRVGEGLGATGGYTEKYGSFSRL